MTDKIDFWQETHSGVRSSTTLFIGVLFAATAALLHLAQPYLANPNTPANETLTSAFWLIWILGLWILGIAFIWVGNNPFLSSFGTVVGIFHLVQGSFLLVVLFSNKVTIVPPLVFTVGRLMTILLFGLIERGSIGIPLSIMLWVSTLLQLLKITLRLMGTLPEMTPLFESALDTTFLLLICVALIKLGRLLRHMENNWAEEKYKVRHSGFSEFNNPLHKWDD